MNRHLAVAAAISLGLHAMPAVAAPCTATLSTSDDLQVAIANASDGDVLCLQAGLHSPWAPLELDRPITLQGPQVGVDPRPTTGTLRQAGNTDTEAIVDGEAHSLGTLVRILADDVVIDGLVFRNADSDLIESLEATATSGVIIRNNIIHTATADEAVQLRGTTDPLIARNHIYGIAGDGINVCCSTSGAVIEQNELHNIWSTNAAIYTYSNGAGGITQRIAGNLLYNIGPGDGIKVGIRTGADVDQPCGEVSGNVLHDLTEDGISIYTSDGLVTANEIYNSGSTNGAIYVAFDVDSIIISWNVLYNNGTTAIKIGGATHYPTNVQPHHNCIENNKAGIWYNNPGGSAVVVAESNWWGDPSGPSGQGQGTGDSVSADTDFEPWLTSGADCAPDFDSDGDPDYTDCEPDNAAIHHAAAEICDGLDNDCDGAIDEAVPVDASVWYADTDADGFGDIASIRYACTQPVGYVSDDTDCDDTDSGSNPAAAEMCDAEDRDCDGDPIAGATDPSTWFADADADGFGDSAVSRSACTVPVAHVADDTDCDDTNAAARPGGAEVCDGADNDCDGMTDDVDGDEDGHIAVACGGADCDDRDHHIMPGAIEACFDGLDNDCDGAVDNKDVDCGTPQPEDDGCGCSSGPASALPLACVFALVALRRRRR